MKLLDNDLVLVYWVDSRQPISNWQYLDDLPEPLLVNCVSVGWRVFENSDVLMLAPNIGDIKFQDCKQISGLITIAVCSIQKIQKIDT